MAHQVKVPAAKTEDLSLIPRTLKSGENLFLQVDPLTFSHMHGTYTQTHINMCTYKTNKNVIF